MKMVTIVLDPGPRRWALGVLLLALAGGRLLGETVREVHGSTIYFSGSEDIARAPGDTARICRVEVVQGKSANICSAVLRISAVKGRQGEGVLVKGDPAAIEVGMNVVFDRRASLGKAPPKPRPVDPDDPAAQMRAGDEAFGAAKWLEAIGYYERLLALVPGDLYAVRRLEEARIAERDAVTRREILARRQREASKVAYFESWLDRAVAANDADSAGSYARMLLEIDPSDPRALAVRDAARNTARTMAERAAGSWDLEGFLAAWAEYSEDWGDAQALELARAERQARIDAVVAPWQEKSCGEIPGMFSVLDAAQGGRPELFARTEDFLRSKGCRYLPPPRLSGGEAPLNGTFSAVVIRRAGKASGPLNVFVGYPSFKEPGREAGEVLLFSADGPTEATMVAAAGLRVEVTPYWSTDKPRQFKDQEQWLGIPAAGSTTELCIEEATGGLRKVLGPRLKVLPCPASQSRNGVIP